jgi:Immunity protein 15
MTGASELAYASAFEGLLVGQGLADPQVFAHVDVFDEAPLYSRLSQISFLGGLPIAEQNRQLIAAAVRYLAHVTEYFSSQTQEEHSQVLRLVSITGWWVDDDRGGRCANGTTEAIRPNLWIGNLGHERMKEFRLYKPQSQCAAFVAGVVVGLARYGVFESRVDEAALWCPRRVYIGRIEHLPTAILS